MAGDWKPQRTKARFKGRKPAAHCRRPLLKTNLKIKAMRFYNKETAQSFNTAGNVIKTPARQVFGQRPVNNSVINTALQGARPSNMLTPGNTNTPGQSFQAIKSAGLLDTGQEVTPTITTATKAAKKPNYLLYGGIAAAALLLIFLLKKK